MKFALVTAATNNFTTGSFLFGLQTGVLGSTGYDRMYSFPQIASGILSSASMTSVSITTSTISSSAISSSAITSSTISGSTIGTSTINNSTLNTATINTATIANATINTATINNAALNTATISTATINNATIGGNSVLNAPTINTAVMIAPTISTSTISNLTANTATINNATINTGTLNRPTLNTATINSAVLNTAVINSAVINTAVINSATLNTATINSAAINTAIIVNASINLLTTISASQLGSAIVTSAIFPAGYSKIILTFENVCPVSTALLTTSLNLQVATSGTAFVSASYVSNLAGFVQGTTFIIGTTSAFYLSGITATTVPGTTGTAGVCGWVEITNPNNAVFRKSIRGELNYLTPGAVSTLTNALVMPSGFWDGASNAISAINVAFQTGAIATGTIRVYGVV